MALRDFLVRRVIYLVFLIFIVITFNFILFRLPTFLFGIDPVAFYIGPLEQTLSPDEVDAIYRTFGLVRDPTIFDWINMYINYVISTVSFNFGYSFLFRQPVIQQVAARLPNTLILMGISTLIAVQLGIWTGSRAAADIGSKKDIASVTTGLFIYSLPIFWLGLILLFLFAFVFPVFPLAGTISRPPFTDPLLYTLDVMHHLALPTITLAFGSFGGYTLLMRNTMVDVLTEDYIQTARAKGLPERIVINKHAMKNAFLPMLTTIALAIAGLINGAVLTETVFNWYGMGRLIYDSLVSQDWPVSQGLFYIITLLTIFANLIADVLYGVLDPRIKY